MCECGQKHNPKCWNTKRTTPMTKKLNFQNIILGKLFLKNNINFNLKGYLFEIIIINYV